MSAAAPTTAATVAWHDAECAGYRADLELWERLASEHAADRPVLDLGAGSGRVALHLAGRGHPVVAVDNDPELLAALAERAAGTGAPVEAVGADVRELALGRRFALIVAPMQLLHLLGGREGRSAALRRVAGHLAPGGVLAAAVLDDRAVSSGRPDPLPDVREVDGWVHSSLPLEVRATEDTLELIRLRQTVSPAGRLSEQRECVALDRFPLERLEREGREAGLGPARREQIAETAEHVGSLALIWGGRDE